MSALGGGPQGPLRDLYGHSPLDKMFAGADVYGVGHEPLRAARPPLRLGVIGAGGVAQSKWLPAVARLRVLWDPVELAGVADPAERQGRKVGEVFGCTWYADHQSMLEHAGLDAVIVASPDRLHAPHALDALERGVAVLVEKPFCTSLADATRLARAGAERGTVVMPVCNLRFSPPIRRAAQLSSTAASFRPPIVLTGRMQLGYDYVELLEGATVHLLDLARLFLGDVVGVAARGLGARRTPIAYPFSQAAITLEFASGSLAQLFTSSQALSLKPWLRLEVHGEGSWLVVDDVYELAVYDSETGPTKSFRPVLASTLVLDEEFGGYLPQLEHFLEVVRGEELPLVTAADGLAAVELIAASHLAIGRGREVRLPLEAEAADAEVMRLREGC